MISPYVYPGVRVTHKLYQKTRVSFVKCTRVVCREFDIAPSELKIRRRKREIVAPKQLLQTFLFNLTLLTTSQVGKIFDMDHSSVSNSMKRVKADYQTDRRFRERVDDMLFNLKAMHLKETLMA